MNGVKPDIHAIFCDALDRESPEDLARYLGEACGGDTALRAQVEELPPAQAPTEAHMVAIVYRLAYRRLLLWKTSPVTTLLYARSRL